MKYNTYLHNFLRVWTTKTIHCVGEKTTVSCVSGFHCREPDQTAKSFEATGPYGAFLLHTLCQYKALAEEFNLDTVFTLACLVFNPSTWEFSSSKALRCAIWTFRW